ncbi:MAG: hypothetical protein JOY68_10525, partial [Candidatus Dormibacteraeota bacterium]|nr:hypothetical protein [Candidatus Dormibacteraeota bacterium]
MRRRAAGVAAAAAVLCGSGIALTAPATAAAAAVKPNAVGDLDCNGFSAIQKPARTTMVCADPRTNQHQRFEDNGWYIGHDEPSVRFLSNRAGTGDDVNLTEVLPKDPAAKPTVTAPGGDVVDTFELTVAPWISMDICDPNSYPQLTCAPESDANAPAGRYPGGGAAFLELQFYPPGFAPFADSISCDNAHWCSALNIDSLECTQSGTCNNNCVEPVNFAFIATDGVPSGPPSPQLTDAATFTPDSHTFLMNPGDKVKINIFDASISGGHALEIRESDLTTGKSGYMIASAANGFMNTSIADCSGTPFNFEPEYSSAAAGNYLPWGPGAYNINNEFEIGHFEPCTSVSGATTTTSPGYRDTYWLHCKSPYEAGSDSSAKNEVDDSPCFKAGDTHGGHVAPNRVTGCDVFDDAVGDLDYDGTPYRADWPVAQTAGSLPSTFLFDQPNSRGVLYPQIQFITDMS